MRIVLNLKHKKAFISLIISVFVCVSTNITAQNSTIDSLKLLVQKADRDSTMVSLLNDLSKEVLNEGNIPESLEYAEKALNLSNELGYAKGKAYALKWTGIAHYYQGDYKKVLDNWTKSLENFSAINDTIGMANMLGNIGASYHEQGETVMALDQYLKSLHLSQKMNNSYRSATALINIGGLYLEMKEYDKALNYFGKMETHLDGLNDLELDFHYLMGIGEAYLSKMEYDSALKSFEEALEINENTLNRARNLSMLGKTEFQRGNTEKASSYLNAGLIAAKENDQNPDIVEALVELGNIYQISDPAKAKELYDEAEVIAKEMGAIYDLRDIYLGMFQIYANKEDYKSAFQYQSQYLNVKDSLSNVERDNKIGNLQLNFDLQKTQDEIAILEREAKITELEGKRQKNMTYASGIVSALVLLLAIALYRRYRYIHKTKKVIEIEKNRSESLLLNILPQETALELKQNGKVAAKQFDSVSVMFTDFKEFTRFSHDLSPDELVKSVDFYFSKFDEIMEKHGLEKIKTIGDAYMCAAGLPFPVKDHADKMIQAAFEIIDFMEVSKNNKEENIMSFKIRIGINSGPVVAGVVGSKKFAYDIWGDTVNVAARMESASKSGKINISEYTYQLVKDKYDCEYRGELKVKNKGVMKMYFVNGVKNKETDKVLENDKVKV